MPSEIAPPVLQLGQPYLDLHDTVAEAEQAAAQRPQDRFFDASGRPLRRAAAQDGDRLQHDGEAPAEAEVLAGVREVIDAARPHANAGQADLKSEDLDQLEPVLAAGRAADVIETLGMPAPGGAGDKIGKVIKSIF